MATKTDFEKISEHTAALKNMVLDLKNSYNTLNNGIASEEEHECGQIATELSMIESKLFELFATKESEV